MELKELQPQGNPQFHTSKNNDIEEKTLYTENKIILSQSKLGMKTEK